MSTDKRVTEDLLQTLQDGTDGFKQAAERLNDSDRPELVSKMRHYASQRARFSQELEALAAAYGDDVEENGSVAAAVHRGWMKVKDIISGASPSGVLDAAEQGEDHAVTEYRKALESDISPELRTVIERQFVDIQQAHNDIRSLRETVS